ncbi:MULTISPECIES: ABC transporter substrate-binding protein [Pseudomonas]|uniref:ABC transporter substrate-binding protein n=1 Tax=Pseudomonas putida TaxID=303 RepID=A0AAD0L6M4_PSEPU|nr:MULTISPECIES: ABC transporter substrate-binding protein [Pseudomonas]ANC03698.1 monooxygenase [Pseudomonas putida]AXA25422.1 ABC transporter substrate-binding protein [Pseudomonas putida]KAB5625795.1 ABC transporter substrate-binding protein [Pseudomonas putida]MBH3460004.1 ABC transporter substrate-binding protein [Pseudomonas putida]MBK0061572.1 ABC transporter substrate-binding protein [Pseudomonas sp. S44]
MSHPLDTLWYTRCPVPTGLGIAVQQGWLQADLSALGTQVQSLREADDQAVRESHFDHSLRNSVRHGGSIPAIWARAQGRETRVIGLSWADEAQLILSLPGSGIRTVKDLAGRRFGLPDWAAAQIDFTRAQALRGLENALRLEGLQVGDVQLVNYRYDGTFSDRPVRNVAGTPVSTTQTAGRNLELAGLLRGEVDAIFLKGASAVQLAHAFGLHTVIDTGAHPDPLVRSNNGTPRTLAVDSHLLAQHPQVARTILAAVLRAEDWAQRHPDETRRYLARETNSSEYWVSVAYGNDAHLRLRTALDEQALAALQDFVHFLKRWRFIPASFTVSDWIDRGPLDALLANTPAMERTSVAL